MTLPESAIFVTQTALDACCRARHLRPVEAQRELLGLLTGRELRQGGDRRTLTARARSRTLQVDVSATVSLEPPLAVVLAVNVRDYR